MARELEQTARELQRLDQLLQHRARLGICVLLAGVDRMSFSRLKELLRLTDGNLGAQLRKLEDAGYLSVHKAFIERRPVSWYALTEQGTHALGVHLAGMEMLVKSVERGARGGDG
ncbi:MAG: hypothetical protein AMK75_04320 [Planctomycetes bacterium SM23_65]|nr:MAG: hypothetical protein AMK75_04320 [Planctomycetes bacterium SM23_65]